MESIDITIVSTLKRYQCRTTISIYTNQTVDSLIKECCTVNEWTRRSDFALCNQQQEILYKGDKLHLYDLQNGDELYLIIHESELWACGCSQWWMLAAICLLIAVTGITAVTIMEVRSRNTSNKYKYAVGLDAGSSHTQLYIYRWLGYKNNGTGIITEMFSYRCLDAVLSSFANNTSAAGPALIPCLDKAWKELNTTQDASVPETPILLGATAGMRLLKLRNSSIADEIMDSVRGTIKSFPFNTSRLEDQVRIINGSEEGAFAWIATNFLSGTFGFKVMSRIEPYHRLHEAYSEGSVNDSNTLAALDLGGASTQISFEPAREGAITGDYKTLDLYGSNYTVYTHSYLCYGINEALRKYWARLVQEQEYNETISDPCAPRDNITSHVESDIFQSPCTQNISVPSSTNEDKVYSFQGTSNATECHRITLELFDFNTTCLHPPCTFNGTHQPPVHGPFLAFSAFYYTMRFLNLTDNTETRSLDDFVRATSAYCNKTWEQVEHIPLQTGESPSVLVTSCFRANYIHTLLVNGYHFNSTSWKSISFRDTINGADLGWILGMMVNTTNLIPAVAPSIESIGVTMFSLLLSFFVLFLVLSVAFTCYARRVAHRERRGNYREISQAPPSASSATTYGSIEDREPLPV